MHRFSNKFSKITKR